MMASASFESLLSRALWRSSSDTDALAAARARPSAPAFSGQGHERSPSRGRRHVVRWNEDSPARGSNARTAPGVLRPSPPGHLLLVLHREPPSPHVRHHLDGWPTVGAGPATV